MHVLVFDTPEVCASAACSLWRDRLRTNPELRLCLPSGNTPLPLYQAMRDSVARGLASFSKAEIFALDEYGGIPADDPGRCSAILRRHLIDHVDLPLHQFHAVPVDEENLDEACARFESEIAPGFDLALLGVGLNGHLGLNEPGTPPDSRTRRVEMHPASTRAAAAYVKCEPLPTWGVTVGLRTLNESKELWLLATGSTKAEIVKRIVTGPADCDLPASLLQAHSDCWLFLDAAAAVGLGLRPEPDAPQGQTAR